VEGELQAILDRLRDDDPTFEAVQRTTLVRPPLETSLDEPIAQASLKALGDVDGIGVAFWADSALIAAAGVPTVIFGPGGEGAHADVEWVDLAQLDRCAEALTAVIDSFCG
jgi:acetylornithine deacetylase